MLRDVLDLAYALQLETYREMGVNFDDAVADLNHRLWLPLGPPAPGEAPPSPTPPPNDEASMAILQAQMKNTQFRGALG